MRKRDMGSHQRVIDQLRHLSGTDITKMQNEFAERFENRPRRRHRLCFSADHDGQRAGLCGGCATADRSVDQRQPIAAACFARFTHVSGCTVE